MSRRWIDCARGGIVIFDTDVLIWIQRGSEKAARVVDRSTDRHISIITYMELLQAATNKKQHDYYRIFSKSLDFKYYHEYEKHLFLLLYVLPILFF